MFIFLLKRLFFGLCILFLLSFLCFAILHYSKASPIFANTQVLSKDLQKDFEAELNLDKALFFQYSTWFKSFLSGDLSNSLISSEPVLKLIKERLLNTIVLGFSSLFFLFILAFFLSILSLIYENSFLEKFISFTSMSFFALPSFCVALILILFFCVYLSILPSSGAYSLGEDFSLLDRVKHLILPTLSLVLSHLAFVLNFMKSTLKQSLNQYFIDCAFARGLSKKRIYLHFIFRDSFASILSCFASMSVSFLMSAYVIEAVFSYEGLGSLLMYSITYKDYPVVLAIVLLSTAFLLLLNSLLEFLSKIMDKRAFYV